MPPLTRPDNVHLVSLQITGFLLWAAFSHLYPFISPTSFNENNSSSLMKSQSSVIKVPSRGPEHSSLLVLKQDKRQRKCFNAL